MKYCYIDYITNIMQDRGTQEVEPLSTDLKVGGSIPEPQFAPQPLGMHAFLIS